MNAFVIGARAWPVRVTLDPSSTAYGPPNAADGRSVGLFARTKLRIRYSPPKMQPPHDPSFIVFDVTRVSGHVVGSPDANRWTSYRSSFSSENGLMIAPVRRPPIMYSAPSMPPSRTKLNIWC